MQSPWGGMNEGQFMGRPLSAGNYPPVMGFEGKGCKILEDDTYTPNVVSDHQQPGHQAQRKATHRPRKLSFDDREPTTNPQDM